jgi:phosphatidylserine/phosphatidylglycerophosphate/cardiolipin synthase-like enzyme
MKTVIGAAMRRAALGAGAALLVLLGACSSLPRIVPDMARTRPAAQIEGVRGPLSAARSKAILDGLSGAGGPTDVLSRHLALEQAISDSPLLGGNQVELLQDGPSTYRAMFAAIDAARDHINMETYILEDDEVGRRFANALIAKQRLGVQVNLIHDGVGTLGTPAEFFTRLSDAEILVLEFNPVNPLTAKAGWDVNQRDHRKLLVVDGRTAFLGGINISSVYTSLISAIDAAQREVLLTNAYFVPDPQLRAALKAAVARGVDVRLVLPARTDSALVFHAGRSYYDELLGAGVRLFERRDVVLHAKTALIDGVWSTVGSTNLDWRSFLHNQELNAVVLGAQFGQRMRASFDADLAQSNEVTLAQWQQRTLDLRVKEMFARLWQYRL